MWKLLIGRTRQTEPSPGTGVRGYEDGPRLLKRGHAMRVIFFYPGEEGTFVDNAEVSLYENGIVHLRSKQEETTTHLQNCEILWKFEVDADERTNKVRLLKPKSEARAEESGDEKNPELR